jgi:replication-associated recombination protein RarA
MNNIPIILTGPPGCGKSYWIQKYAEQIKKQLFVCPCRKDRTLREGRQKLHVWARRTEPAILWLEGADDLTPEAQAFLRRILETHASDVLFILECRDAGRLQEPIRSRCMIKRVFQPTWNEIEQYLVKTFKGINTNEIFEFLKVNEYSYRRAKQCAYLQLQCPDTWKATIEHKKKENETIKKLEENELISYMREGYNPEVLISTILKNDNVLRDYGKCNELAGSLWAFLGCALSKASITTKNE